MEVVVDHVSNLLRQHALAKHVHQRLLQILLHDLPWLMSHRHVILWRRLVSQLGRTSLLSSAYRLPLHFFQFGPETCVFFLKLFHALLEVLELVFAFLSEPLGADSVLK